MNKSVTIIIPVYNAQKHIEHCLDSLVMQTSKDFVTLLIDDGSTDNSLLVLQQYEKQYPTLFTVISKKNEGVAKTRELGIKLSKTPYVMFVDNDDFLDKDYVDVLLGAIVNMESDIVICGYRRASLTTVYFEIRAYDDEWTKYRINPPWARIYKRAILVENDVVFLDYVIGEDTYFNMMAYRHANKISSIDYCGYNWYTNQNSVSNTSQKGLQDNCDILYTLSQIDLIYCNNNDKMLNYFYIHYAFLYLLFSGKSAKSDVFEKEFDRVYGWLKEMGFLEHRLSFLNPSLRSEPMKIRMQIVILIGLKKLSLIKFFAKYYCR